MLKNGLTKCPKGLGRKSAVELVQKLLKGNAKHFGNNSLEVLTEISVMAEFALHTWSAE